MRNILLCCFLLMLQQQVFSQFRQIAESQEFDEAETGWSRLMVLKNGYTAYIVLGKDENEIRIFDEKHQPKAHSKIKPSFSTTGKGLFINAIFEVKGDIVCFISVRSTKNFRKTYRLILDGATGGIKKEDLMAELEDDKYWESDYDSRDPQSPTKPPFVVNYDPEYDQYVVTRIYVSQTDLRKRTEISMYDGGHHETARFYIASAENGVDVFTPLYIGFRAGKAYAFGYGKKDGVFQVLVGEIQKEKKLVHVKGFIIPNSNGIQGTMVAYNKAIDKFIMLFDLSTKELISHAVYKKEIWLRSVDPNTLEAGNGERINLDEAQNATQEVFGKKAKFKGTAVNLYIHNDGSYTAAIEEVLTLFEYSMAMDMTKSDLVLGNLALYKFNKEGVREKMNFIPKYQISRYLPAGPKYLNFYQDKAWRIDVGDQYKFFKFIRHNDREYVLYNDEEKSVKRMKEGNISMHPIVSTRDLHSFELTGEKIPDGKTVFGESSGIRHQLAMPGNIVYDELSNKLVMLRLNTGRKNKVQLVWMEL